MPEHTSFFSYFISLFPALRENMRVFGNSFLGDIPVDAHSAEPLVASIAVILVILLLAVLVRPALAHH